MAITVTGTITTQNLNPTTGTPTPGSSLKLMDNSSSTFIADIDSVSVQVTGTYTGALTPQISNDAATWVAVGPVMVLNVGTGAYSQTIASATVGIFNINVGGYRYFRISAIAAVTGTATITLNGSEATSATNLSGALPTGANTVGTFNLGTGGTGATALGKAEDAAHTTGDTGVPYWGVRYEALTAPTSAANDYSLVTVDDLGKTVVIPFAPPINQLQGLTAAMTATADTSVIAAPGASIRTYVTGVHVVNTHATVGTEVHIKDGTTIVDRFFVPALSERTREYPTPLKLTANAILNAANVTTGSNTYVQAVGFKAL